MGGLNAPGQGVGRLRVRAAMAGPPAPEERCLKTGAGMGLRGDPAALPEKGSGLLSLIGVAEPVPLSDGGP
ncbi:hypothetical protein GCM10010468_46450 [Actinocorallia longicatena]|uniref:Uncharacterized protein n=1 Tax=Actinocorallia longicatena TaxID=111803 RepID=A0ABP6QE78_9ACTN